jgi:uncharacterized protein YlbG (UPF0298 family)
MVSKLEREREILYIYIFIYYDDIHYDSGAQRYIYIYVSSWLLLAKHGYVQSLLWVMELNMNCCIFLQMVFFFGCPMPKVDVQTTKPAENEIQEKS